MKSEEIKVNGGEDGEEIEREERHKGERNGIIEISRMRNTNLLSLSFEIPQFPRTLGKNMKKKTQGEREKRIKKRKKG